MGIVSWIVLGAVVGLLVNRGGPGQFPGGLAGTVVGGAAGAFLGGATFTLVASRAATGLDPISFPVALLGAALLLTLVRRAAYAEPHAP